MFVERKRTLHLLTPMAVLSSNRPLRNTNSVGAIAPKASRSMQAEHLVPKDDVSHMHSCLNVCLVGGLPGCLVGWSVGSRLWPIGARGHCDFHVLRRAVPHLGTQPGGRCELLGAEGFRASRGSEDENMTAYARSSPRSSL